MWRRSGPALFMLLVMQQSGYASAAADERDVAASLKFELNHEFSVAGPAAARLPYASGFKSEFDFSAGLNQSLELFTHLVLEPVRGQREGDRLFDREGLFLEEAGVALALDDARITLGKFNPRFGLAWDTAPGIFGDDFADEYEITEQLGMAMELHGELGGNRHRAYVAVFTDDRSVFSDSVFTRRGRNRLAPDDRDGLSQLQSTAFVLEGGLDMIVPGLEYHAGYRELAAAGAGPDNRGFVLSLIQNDVSVGEFEANLQFEWAEFQHFYQPGDRLRMVTPAISIQRSPVGLSVSYTEKAISNDNTSEDEWLLQANLEYSLGRRQSVSLGWKREKHGEFAYDRIGIRLKADLDL